MIVIATACSALANAALAGKRCARHVYITLMGIRLNLATSADSVLIEINLDSPPAGFADLRPGLLGNLVGHHDIVGIALDRNLNNPMQSDARYNNFEDAVARWLGGTDAPEAFCGFNRRSRWRQRFPR